MRGPFQPAVAARALREAAGAEWARSDGRWQLHSGGEDLPNAYRSLPVAPAATLSGTVTWNDSGNG